jgi:hypothetical protein
MPAMSTSASRSRRRKVLLQGVFGLSLLVYALCLNRGKSRGDNGGTPLRLPTIVLLLESLLAEEHWANALANCVTTE